MTERTPALVSRLPQVGTTIFSVMSALAAQCGAVNLGQGFPDFDCDSALLDAVGQAMRAGHNQYAPMAGVPALRQAVATKIEATHARPYCPEAEITITAGATQAILTAILAIVHPGDEVIVLDPCYDSYVPNIALAGGVIGSCAHRVVAEDDIHAPMEAVLDPPVLANGLIQARSMGGQAAEVEAMLKGGFAPDRPFGSNHGEGSRVRPALRSMQAIDLGEGKTTTHLHTTVILFDDFVEGMGRFVGGGLKRLEEVLHGFRQRRLIALDGDSEHPPP